MAKKTAPTGGKKKVDMSSALRKASSLWNKGAKEKATEYASGVTEFDDGRYEAKLTSATLEVSGNGRPQVKFVWKFLSGDYKGKEKWAFSGVESEDNIAFLMRDIARLGYEVEEIDDLAEELPKILKELTKDKPAARISLKTKGEFQNVNINRLMDEDDVENDGDEEDGEEEDGGDESEDSDEEEDESDEEEKPKGKKGKKAKKPKDEEEDDEEESDDDDGDEEADDEEDGDEEDESDEEDGGDDEEEVTVRVGSKVVVKTKAGKKKAEVTEILAKENAIRVTTADGKKLKLPADRILSVEDVPETPKDKKTGKKTSKK